MTGPRPIPERCVMSDALSFAFGFLVTGFAIGAGVWLYRRTK